MIGRGRPVEAAVFEAMVDGLANGVEYTVTVSALPSHGGENGPPSEARTATPRAGGGDTEDVPVPALPLAGAGVLAGLLASAAFRLRRAGRRAAGRRRRGSESGRVRGTRFPGLNATSTRAAPDPNPAASAERDYRLIVGAPVEAVDPAARPEAAERGYRLIVGAGSGSSIRRSMSGTTTWGLKTTR